ncbi:hypothetical protein KBG31_03725, partial [Patescibacteria group bacterium]|nr:hypothetical protein [Patescibacteria group bacterium]
DWEVYSTTNNEDALAEWSFKTAGGETKAIFFIEEKGGNFSEALMGCSLNVVTNCGEKELEERVFKTALFQKLIGVYVLEGEESNLVILDVSGGNALELEGVLTNMKIESR